MTGFDEKRPHYKDFFCLVIIELATKSDDTGTIFK